MEFAIKSKPDKSLVLEIPDAAIPQLLGKLSASSAATLADSEAKLQDVQAKLEDAEKRATKAEAELNDVRGTIQNLTREQWEEMGKRLGFMIVHALPADSVPRIVLTK